MTRQPVTTGIPFFPAHECACKGSGIIKMDPFFATALPRLREAWGKPLLATSICRTPSHNAAVGGNPRSLHLTDNPAWPSAGTMAADIEWNLWPIPEKLRFARLAWSMGWAVGLHNAFCHIDRRGDLGLRTLPRRVFLYGSWSSARAFRPEDVAHD